MFPSSAPADFICALEYAARFVSLAARPTAGALFSLTMLWLAPELHKDCSLLWNDDMEDTEAVRLLSVVL
jgi:hypothetical protein